MSKGKLKFGTENPRQILDLVWTEKELLRKRSCVEVNCDDCPLCNKDSTLERCAIVNMDEGKPLTDKQTLGLLELVLTGELEAES